MSRPTAGPPQAFWAGVFLGSAVTFLVMTLAMLLMLWDISRRVDAMIERLTR